MGSKVSLVKTQGVFNKRTCQDCKERMNINNFPVISSGCRHLPKTCLMCLLSQIHAHMDSGRCDQLVCPFPKCEERLSPAAITRMPYTKELMYEYISAVSGDEAPSTEDERPREGKDSEQERGRVEDEQGAQQQKKSQEQMTLAG